MNNELRTRLMDFLDGLLEPEAEEAVVDLLASDPAAAAELERVKRLRDAIYAPVAVPRPDAALKDSVLHEIWGAPRPSRRGRVLRYAASFAAGVLATLALASPPSTPGESTNSAEVPASIESDSAALRDFGEDPEAYVEYDEFEYDEYDVIEYEDRLPGYYDEAPAPVEFARRIR